MGWIPKQLIPGVPLEEFVKTVVYLFVLAAGFVFYTGNILYAQTHTVTITMNEETLTILKKNQSYLYVFKAVRGKDWYARPLVWFRIEPGSIMPKTYVKWTNLYQAYISVDEIAVNKTIDVGSHKDISPGQVWKIGEGNCNQTYNKSESAAAVLIENCSGTQYTCGISEMWGDKGSYSPYCAYPLYGNSLQAITPLNKILLIFSNKNIAAGTVIEYFYNTRGLDSAKAAYSPCILIDLTGSHVNEFSLDYDINKGWGWGSSTCAKSISPTSNFVKLLIEDDL